MAMTFDAGLKGISSEINVTPLIDVLLVLLTIFMVIVPVLPKGESARVPQPGKEDGNPDSAIVVSVLGEGSSHVTYLIDQHPVEKANLQAQLANIYANRANRILFIQGDQNLDYAEIAQVIDTGHAVGADQIGLLTPNTLAGR